jgi:PEGA domain
MWIAIGFTALVLLGLGGYLILPGLLAGNGDGAAGGDTTPADGDETPTDDGGVVEPKTPVEPITGAEDATAEDITEDEDVTEDEDITEEETPTEEEPTPDEDGATEVETPTPEPETPTPVEDAGGLTGKVTISSNPMGASFTIDGTPKGSTPLTVDLPYGSHTIRVDMADHVAQEQTVDVKAASVFVDFTLEKAVEDVIGKLTVFTNPEPGATLFVDGVRKGKTPVTIDITRGKHQLRVELEGFPVQEETIDLSDLEAGETRRRVIALQ